MDMHKNTHTNRNRTTMYGKQYVGKHNEREKIKTVDKRYIVSSQTAYHIRELALQENTTEGRIIDKIMRSYLCNLAIEYRRTHKDNKQLTSL